MKGGNCAKEEGEVEERSLGLSGATEHQTGSDGAALGEGQDAIERSIRMLLDLLLDEVTGLRGWGNGHASGQALPRKVLGADGCFGQGAGQAGELGGLGTVIVQEAIVGTIVLLGNTNGRGAFQRSVDENEVDLVRLGQLVDDGCCRKWRASVALSRWVIGPLST